MNGLSTLGTKVNTSKTSNNSDSESIDLPSYQTVREEGNIEKREGWHKPGSTGMGRSRRGCTCSKVTDKGAYRDEIIEYNGKTVYYLHQHPILVEDENGNMQLSSCGYQTNTTKDRLNDHLPKGYSVFQRDHKWYLAEPQDSYGDTEEATDFKDGMYLTAEKRTAESL